MAGIDRTTGRPLDGVDHAFQSVNAAVTTTKGSRIMRRHLGSIMPRLVDRGVSGLSLIDFYAAIAEVFKEEPRLRLIQTTPAKDSDIQAGTLVFVAEAIFYPRGHLGDYSEAVTASGSIVVAR